MAQIVGYPGAVGIGDTTTRTNTTSTPPVPLGTVGYDAAGNEYRYIRAGGVIAINAWVGLATSVTPFDQNVVTSGANLQVAGVATAAFAANDCGWVVRNGVASAITAGAVAVATNLTTAAAGAAASSAAGDLNNAVGYILVNSATPQSCYVLGA